MRVKHRIIIAALTALVLSMCACARSTEDTSAVTQDNTAAPGTEQSTPPEQTPPKTPVEYDLPVDGEYVLLYEEEFDSALDLSRWRYRTDEKGGGKNTSNNVSVSDGQLNIRFDKQGDVLTGGGIISKELFGYGYYETKCTLFAEGGGLHSAFWLMGGSGNGISLPKENNVFELDGFEFDSNKPNTISFNLNYKIGRVYGLINKYTVESLSGREVVWGFEWLPDRINWFMDGVLMHTVTQDDQPMFYAQQALWLTALANDTMSGSVNEKLLPAYSRFEYFRYFAKPLAGINLIGSAGFEYNDNVAFESSTDMQTPLSFCEKGNVAASRIERSADAYAGNCMLVHESPNGKAFETYTFQKLYNIPNAEYSVSVAVKGSGSTEICRIEIEGHGGSTVSYDLPISAEWKVITLGSVNVSTNTATIYIHTKGAADARICIDDISFASVDGEKCTEAIPYPNKYIGESSVGEILVNTKSASFATSDGWKKSSVIGDEYASWYKLNATASDYAMWTETASVSGEHDVCVYNVESGGKVQRQKVAIYKDGACIFTHDTADRAGWETIGCVSLEAGESYVIKVENTAQNKTMRVDSVRLTPVSTISYSDCIIMHTQRHYAYIYGVRTSINNIPSPVIDDGKVYIPRAFVESATGASIDAQTTDIGNVAYIDSSALAAIGMSCEVSDAGVLVICKADAAIRSAVLDAASGLFE